MILSDRDIRAALQRLENPLIIDPGFDPQRLQPASLEMTLDNQVLRQGNGFRQVNAMGGGGWLIPQILWEEGTLDDRAFLGPGEFALATTVETVKIPTDLVAQVNGKSSLARQGLIVHTTAGFIDPGFRGQITLELKNVSNYPVPLWAGMPVCQLVFYQMTSPSERPYGSKGLGSHYQGQIGPTTAFNDR